MNALKNFLFPTAFLLTMFSCGNKQEVTEQEQGHIEITQQQFTTDGMQIGEAEKITFESIVKCNGTIVPLPNGMTSLHVPLAGVIKTINCQSGQPVEKNRSLLHIAGNEIVDIQRDFAEAAASYYRLKNEYERVQVLYQEKVTSEKEFIAVESEFKTARAKYHGLKLKIETIGFSVAQIENGDFYASYNLKAPISGVVSGLNVHIGSYVDEQTELMQIINPEMFQLQLSVFASDISNVKKGQTVRFKSANTENRHSAIISWVGMSLDDDSRSIQCYAEIKGNNNLVPIANEYVEAEIVTGTDTMNAVPTEAILKSETGYVVLMLEKKSGDKYLFNKTEVLIGRQSNGYTEILGKKPVGQIAVKGVYNIQ